MTVGREVLREFPPCVKCGWVARFEIIRLDEWQPDEEYEAEKRALQAHVRHTTQEVLNTVPLEELRRRNDVSRIRHQSGQWVVSTYGIECLTDTYAIEKSRLFEPDWLKHMSEKTWVVIEDFEAALKAARRLYRLPISPRLRFLVFKRDKYRCQICGITATDGGLLQVDHKLAHAKGGSSKIENLWTLCWDCNIGKGTEDL